MIIVVFFIIGLIRFLLVVCNVVCWVSSCLCSFCMLLENLFGCIVVVIVCVVVVLW